MGAKEASRNFSEVMLSNQTFRDFAEAANHNNDAKKWFEDIISGKLEDRFNKLCQTINGKLLLHLIENVNERRSKKKAAKKKNAEMNVDHFHFRVLKKILQTTNLDGIIPADCNEGVRMAVISIIRVLSKEMLRREQNGLVKFADKLRKMNQGDIEIGAADVNSIVGWAIWHLRLKKIELMNKEVDESAKEEQLQNEIDFLETMRFHKSDAIKDPEYCKKCYDSFTRGRDRGRLTLVHAKYFDLGEQIMKKAHSTFTLDILTQDETAEKNTKKKLINDKLLMKKFCKLCVGFKPLAMEQKWKVFLEYAWC